MKHNFQLLHFFEYEAEILSKLKDFADFTSVEVRA